MKTEKEIVEEYKKADFSDRVMLFLAYRDLRDEFMDMDFRYPAGQVEKDPGKQIRPGTNKQNVRRFTMKAISSVIDLETQLLISVGSAVAAGCIPCLQNIVEQARAQGIDEKKMRAAARTGQFMKEQPIRQMKELSDKLLGTHLMVVPAEGACCPAGANENGKSKTVVNVSAPACSCS